MCLGKVPHLGIMEYLKASVLDLKKFWKHVKNIKDAELAMEEMSIRKNCLQNYYLDTKTVKSKYVSNKKNKYLATAAFLLFLNVSN